MSAVSPIEPPQSLHSRAGTPRNAPRTATAIAVALGLLAMWIQAAPTRAAEVAATSTAVLTPPGMELLPEFTVAAVFNAGPREDEHSAGRNAMAVAGAIANLAVDTGVVSSLDDETRLWLDGVGSLPVILEHPNVIALLGVQARALDENSHRLDSLQLAIIVHTRGENAAIQQRVQQLLSLHTNQSQTRLETVEFDGGRYFQLRDNRLQDWAVLAWGAIGDHFVLTLGEGAFAQVLAVARGDTPRLTEDDWLPFALKTVQAHRAKLGWYIHFDRIRAGEDKILAGKIARVRRALHLGATQRGLWAIRYEGRAVEIDGVVREGDRNVHRPVSDSRLIDTLGNNVVPDQAGSYAIFERNARAAMEIIGAAYLVGRSPEGRESFRDWWYDIEARAGMSFDEDILAHVGDHIVIHDHPKHLLRVPLLWTYLFEISGDADTVRKGIDELLKLVRDEMADIETPFKVEKAEDGIWFLRIGIEGPAVTVTDRWIVLSYSPRAVRANAAQLKTGEPASEPAGSDSNVE